MENKAGLSAIRFASFGIGALASTGVSYLFFYVLYPLVVLRAGVIRGGIIMTAISLLACYTAIVVYDRTRRDWLGIEAIKQSVRDYDGGSRARKVVARILQKGGPLALVVLSIKFDPFVTTIYMRPGAHSYGGLTARDWRVFISSLLIGNGYWLLVMYVGSSFIKSVWPG